jgi:hypothetical protein
MHRRRVIMKIQIRKAMCLLGTTMLVSAVLAGPNSNAPLQWVTAINNNDPIPPLEQRTFNSYNQPSISAEGFVVVRASSRGGPPFGPATHGIYTRHMSDTDSSIVRVLDRTHLVASRGQQFDDFLFWNYSGKVPCASHGHSAEGGEDDGEPVRWRSSAFVAVSAGGGATCNTAFKARSGVLRNGSYVDPVDGIYLLKWPGKAGVRVVADTTMAGQELDPEAPPGSIITEVGLEREVLRGKWLAISASMDVEGGEEEDGMAGIYVTRLGKPPPR